MPVIDQQLIQIDAKEDLSVILLDKINSCGCIQSSKLSLELNIPLERLKNSLRDIAKTIQLNCDENYEICCADKTSFDNFVKKLGGLK